MIDTVLNAIGAVCTLLLLIFWYLTDRTAKAVRRTVNVHEEAVQRLTRDQRNMADRLAQLEAFKERMYGDFE